jgi:CTP synthase (UTP-ammonia lyase)
MEGQPQAVARRNAPGGRRKRKEERFMTTALRIGIIGDYQPDYRPHPATNEALSHAASSLSVPIEVTWLPTPSLEEDPQARLSGFDALWCAPGSPYQSLVGALNAIRFAREGHRPFLGTCGGCQHTILEYARHVLGLTDAQHAEYDPSASVLFITPLSCSLVGKTMQVRLSPGSRAHRLYEREVVTEHYYCNFGLNPAYQTQLHEGGLRVVGVDQDGEARIVELADHPFFLATLFVPQVSSRLTQPHPLICAFLRAAM